MYFTIKVNKHQSESLGYFFYGLGLTGLKYDPVTIHKAQHVSVLSSFYQKYGGSQVLIEGNPELKEFQADKTLRQLAPFPI